MPDLYVLGRLCKEHWLGEVDSPVITRLLSVTYEYAVVAVWRREDVKIALYQTAHQKLYLMGCRQHVAGSVQHELTHISKSYTKPGQESWRRYMRYHTCT